MESEDALVDFSAQLEPLTPQPAPIAITEQKEDQVSKAQADQVQRLSNDMTPPLLTQQSSSSQRKARTPTPTISHMSTPPPTGAVGQPQKMLRRGTEAAIMTTEELASASAEQLRNTVAELQAALHEAKMTAAHHQLQYRMLAQESAAMIDRMAVESRMSQSETEVLRNADQAARPTSRPIPPPQLPEGMIPVQKDYYQRMCLEIQQLTEANRQWEEDDVAKRRIIAHQGQEIASLSDKITLMRERILENRDHLSKLRTRAATTSRVESTPRSLYSTPHRSQGLEVLLQASEMTNPEMRSRKGHTRNIHSMSSLPATPQRTNKSSTHHHPTSYHTPSGRQPPLKLPSTAPMPRTSAMRTSGDTIYSHPHLPIPPTAALARPEDSDDEGTVSASDHDEANRYNNENDDSEAETEILDQEVEDAVDNVAVAESRASRAASQMLRSSQEQVLGKRKSFEGSGMIGSGRSHGGGEASGSGGVSGKGMKQTKLVGTVKKAGVERVAAGPDVGLPLPAKRQRTSDMSPSPRAGGGGGGVGLGIAGIGR